MQPTSHLNIVVALPCEARWFLDRYRLSRLENASTYAMYANSARNIYLIVSGVGKIRSAAALSYLHTQSGAGPHTCYLNAGIAGSQSAALGCLFLAHKIIDNSSGLAFYPWPMLTDQFLSSPLLTVDKPQLTYPQAMLVEMEAFGFHQAALNLVTQEQVQTLKIISDNNERGLNQLNSQLVQELFHLNAQSLEKIVDYLLNLSAAEYQQHKPVAYYADFLAQFHFTQYQRHQLHELLRRWQINFPNKNPLTFCQATQQAQTVLQILAADLCR